MQETSKEKTEVQIDDMRVRERERESEFMIAPMVHECLLCTLKEQKILK